MITSATQYEFVDFANGDLPTAGFDGWIMPRRSDPQSPHPVEMLKAEDIAFLVECVRDKVGAFRGLTFPSYNDFAPYWADPGAVALTKSIRSDQMRSIRNYTTTQLGKGFPAYGQGFLSTPLSEVSSFQLASGFDFLNRAHAIVAPQFAGTWAATSQAADFAAEQPVRVAPVEAIFDDAKNLVRPVGTFQFGEAFATDSHFYLTAIEGSVPSGQAAFFGYQMYRTSSKCAFRGNFNPSEIVLFSREFLSSANIWLLYVARNSVIASTEDGDATSSFAEIRAGLIRLSDYLIPGHTATEYSWAILPTGGLSLYNRILSDCGWREFSTSEAKMQEIYPLYSCSIIVEGTPNGRTQWWT